MAKKRIKSELAVIFGPEPSFEGVKVTKKNYNAILIPALQWYGQYGGIDNNNSRRGYHKSWLKEWALANGFKKGSFTIPNQGISTAASAARCALRGFKLNKKHKDWLKETLSNWVPVPKKVINYEANARLLKLKAKVKHENSLTPFLTTFDTAIDEVLGGAKKWDISTTNELNTVQKKELTALYKGALIEFQLLLDGDKKTTEQYGELPKLVKRRLVKIHKEILEEVKVAARRGNVVRKTRAIRRKKAKPASAHVAKLKYLPSHAEYGVASIDVEKIVGANIAYVFDTKKRLLKKYEAMGISGIEVSGTTLKNVKGVQKKIRKPLEQLAGIGSMPKTKVAKLFNEVKAVEKECTGRSNADTVILKVF